MRYNLLGVVNSRIRKDTSSTTGWKTAEEPFQPIFRSKEVILCTGSSSPASYPGYSVHMHFVR